ncbi:uracil-DNA glycosylase [Sabulicella rubraurantiaca]|uniref:uracil-DNA glycosylase n=1 Tax=Sabulicella rubraurantiaca TaxID=2811429 RepID=UPI001A97B6A1|nr:uracil-DNA glycosylase [Sabulicella rubraurantiaca]
MEDATRQALLAALSWQAAMGADEAILAEPQRRDVPPPEPTQTQASPRPTLAVLRPPGGMAVELAAGATSLEELREAMARFEGSPLRETASQLVFADGVPGAPVMVIGEAPGADEDRIGRPFVGVSGRLMDRMMATIGLSRQTNLYITNILPYRPPGNRTPSDAEVALFMPFLHRHIALARPRLLVLAGGVSAKGLLQTREGITRLRGKWQKFTSSQGEVIPVLPTLHPAYLLRNPLAKRDAWRDLLALQRRLNDGDNVAI